VPVAHYAGRAVPVDADGFLTDSSQWTPDIAEAIAAEAGIAPLTSEHWTVLFPGSPGPLAARVAGLPWPRGRQ